MSDRRRRGFLLVAGLSLAVSAGAAPSRRAAAPPSAARAAAPSAAQSRATVEGVLSMIIDHVWEHGDQYWHDGRYTDRIATDRLVIQMEPSFLEPYSTAGWLLENTGKDDEALEIYRRATQVGPNEWKTWHELGTFHWQRKNYSEAIRVYERAVTKRGAPIFVWKQLAHCYEKSGQLQKALGTWNKIKEIAPSEPATAGNMARIQRLLREREAGGERT
jgi:tetratricopeptide (TPR) repeat protein